MRKKVRRGRSPGLENNTKGKKLGAGGSDGSVLLLHKLEDLRSMPSNLIKKENPGMAAMSIES